jgi:hypothetical protein
LHLDVHQAGTVAHKINACKWLNAGLLVVSLLALTPSVPLAEDTALAVDEVFLAVVINQQQQGVVFLLRSDDRLFAGAQDLRRWRLHLTMMAKIFTHLMRWQGCRMSSMNPVKR